MLLGAIADDFTGGSDLGNTLAKEGMRVVQFVGVQNGPAPQDCEAGVVSLKSRTIPPEEAVRQSLAACDWLLAQGCRQILFKYCSTFDSTPKGTSDPSPRRCSINWAARRWSAPPSRRRAARSIAGHLFVADRLLSESGMRDHPLTPMTDPDLRRWLGLQAKGPVGHVPFATIRQDSAAIRAALDAEAKAGRRLIVTDALSTTISAPLARRSLATGSSRAAPASRSGCLRIF